MRPGWLFILLAMLAATTLVLAACGGDDDDDDDSEDGSPTAEATAENDDDEDTDDSEPTDDDDEDDDDPFAELEEITDEYEQVDGSVTYTVTTDGEESTWTVYTEGDIRIDFGDEEGAFVSITT